MKKNQIRFIAGILHRDKVSSFELMLWRMCKGNVLLKTAEIEEITEDPQTVNLKKLIYKLSLKDG